jgi:hypothetical protein
MTSRKTGSGGAWLSVQFATYITNHLRIAAVDDIPPQAVWSNMPIDVSHFRVPLCTCWYYEEIENREVKSLSPVRRKATFVGYATDSPARAHLLTYDIVKDAITGIIYRRRYEDVVMDERTQNGNNADHDGMIFGNDDKLTFCGSKDASHAVAQEAANWHPTLGVAGWQATIFSFSAGQSHGAHPRRDPLLTRQPSRTQKPEPDCCPIQP